MKYKNITKKKGDDGLTDLYGGGRISKGSDIIEVIGTIDEFNASIGLCHEFLDETDRDSIKIVQKHLFGIMSELSCDKNKKVVTHRMNLAFLDSLLEIFVERLEDKTQTDWILYGEGGSNSSRIDFCTTICRKCERYIVKYDSEKFTESIQYFNRLSKVLFLLARLYDKHQ